jgi:phenylacetate-CoA ligase
LFRNVLFPLYEGRLRGRATLRHLEELERSQWLPTAALLEKQWLSTLEALEHAERHVPYYRRRFAEYGVRVRDVHAPGDLTPFPVLTKAEVRAHAAELVSETFHGRLHKSGTGGSTGAPIRFAYDHATYERRMAAATRADRWAGGEIGEKEAHVWGIVFDEAPLSRVKRTLHEALLRKKMLCAFDLSERRLGEVLDALVRYEPRLVVGYTSPLYHVARHALASGRVLPRPRGVIATAEKLFAHQRETIERAFGAPVFDRYGCREVMLIGSECDRHQGKHMTVENVFVEILRGGKPAAPGEPGEVILTDLVNRSMPFIRYKNEDVATLAADPCACGRGLPLLASVEGRVLDMIVGPEGQLLAGEFFPHLLKDYAGVDRFQVHQGRDRTITLRIKPGAGWSDDTSRLIEGKLRSYLGPRADFHITTVDDIPVTAGGKFRVAVSEVPIDFGSVAA